jgi:hypothetical protein
MGYSWLKLPGVPWAWSFKQNRLKGSVIRPSRGFPIPVILSGYDSVCYPYSAEIGQVHISSILDEGRTNEENFLTRKFLKLCLSRGPS